MPPIQIGRLAQLVRRSPFTAAAAVFAPVFAKNEDRGYFRTALITTPIVFASGSLVPRMFAGVQGVASEARQVGPLLQKAEKWTRYEQKNYNDLRTLFRDKEIPDNALDRAVSNYLVSERRSRDFLKERQVLSKWFNRKFVIPNDLYKKGLDGDLRAQRIISEVEDLQGRKGAILTNALQSSRRAALTTSEMAEEVAPVWETAANKIMGNDEMMAMFNQYSDRPTFISSLRNKLREVKDLNYAGTLRAAGSSPTATALSSFNVNFRWHDQAELAFEQQAPDAYKNLEEALSLGRVESVTALSDDVVNGKVGRVLAVKVSRYEKGNIKEITIPVVDPATGTVRLGGNAIGVADYVIDPAQGYHRIDSWVSKMMLEQTNIPIDEVYSGGPSLKNEINAHAYWNIGDPMDARRMTELGMADSPIGDFNAQARKLRSHAAKYTKLPLFTNKDKEQVSYNKLSAAEQNQVVRDTLNNGQFINMSSDAGTYEGRFVLREAALLSPYGAPSAEKQDSIWRAVTKDFRLVGNTESKLGWRSTAWEGLTGSANLNAAKFTVGSIDPEVRTALINEMKGTGRDHLAQALGRMGETGFVLNEDFSNNFSVQGVGKYNVNEVGVKVGDVVMENDILGFRDYDRVKPAQSGIVSDIARDENGFVINVTHQLDMQGAKLDIGGVKGMVPQTLLAEHAEELRNVVNDYYNRTGAGDYIPEGVNTFAATEYFANKVEPAHAYLGIGGDLVSRLQAAGAGNVASDYLSKMNTRLSTSYQDGQLVIDASKIQSLKDKDAAARLIDLSNINEEFFKKAGEAIRQAGGYQDPVLSAYVHSGKELGDWMLKNQLPATGFAWDHSLVNAPRFASITQDINSYMALGGNFAGLKALQNRVVTSSGGDAGQAVNFMSHVVGGDFSQPFGKAVPINKAFRHKGNLVKAEHRKGSIFDSSLAEYKDNFSLDLGNGTYLPVPGTGAYLAEGKPFGPGEYQTTRWQNSIQDLAFESNPEKKSEIQNTIINQYRELFGTGKGNVLRPHLQDPLSIAGVFSNVIEEDNPFVARISPELAEKVRSSRLRKALLEGEEVLGALHRQPTNTMMYMRFKVDKTMYNTLDVGVAERISRAFIGDQDKDTAYALLFDANLRTREGQEFIYNAANPLERDAASEALEAITSGRQLRNLEAWESVRGTEEVANRVTNFRMKSLVERNATFAKAVHNRTETAVQRTAGGAIGSFSNILTEMSMYMERNPALLKNQEQSARLSALLFEASRQAPISARKTPSFSLERAQMHIGQLKDALASPNSEDAAERLQAAIFNLNRTIHSGYKETGEYEYLMGQGAEDLKVFAEGRDSYSKLAKQAFTAIADPSKPFADQFANKNLDAIFQNVGKTLGPIHGGASYESASKLGAVSEFYASKASATAREARVKVAGALAEHGTGIAIGLGALAVLGVAMTHGSTPVANFSRASSNQYKAENHIGVNDYIPGEPMPGEMATAPPRREVGNQPGVRTAVVAPMRQTSDLYVKMKSEDHSRAAETARQLSMIPGSGNTNVTVNYRDRTRLRSLRTRDKIQQIMR